MVFTTIDVSKASTNRYKLFVVTATCYVDSQDIEEAFMLVREAKGWDMDKQHRIQWCCSSTARFRVMARHVQQARLKNAKWTKAFEFTDEGQDDEGEAEGEDVKDPEPSGHDHTADFLVGWDPEHNNAWRMGMDSATAVREFAKEVKVPEGASEDDALVATFADGSVHEIPGYTCGDFQPPGKADGDHPQPVELKSPYYHGRLPDGGLVSIKDRKNAGVLFLAVVCPEGQIAQCRSDHFGTLQNTVQKLTPLVERFVECKMNRIELKKQLQKAKEEERAPARNSKGAAATAVSTTDAQPQASSSKRGRAASSPAQPSHEPEPSNKKTKTKPEENDVPMFDDEDTLPWGFDE